MPSVVSSEELGSESERERGERPSPPWLWDCGRDCGQSPCGALVRYTSCPGAYPADNILTASSDAGEEYERCKNHSETALSQK